MARETEVVALRVEPGTRTLLERAADERGLSLAALLRDLAETSVGVPTQFDRWTAEVNQALDSLAFIRDTEGLATLVPKVEDKVLALEGDLEELLDAIEEKRAEIFGEEDEEEEED